MYQIWACASRKIPLKSKSSLGCGHDEPANLGLALSRPIRSRISRKSTLGTTTLSIWKMMFPECLTTLAPILMSFSRSVLSDHFFIDLGNCQTPQEIIRVVSQSKELKTDLIIHEIMTRKPHPVQGVFAFLNPLLSSASLVIEFDNIAGLPPKVRHNETNPGKKLSCMPFDFSNHPSSDFPTGRLIPKAMIQDNRLLRWTTCGSRQHMFNFLMQYLILLQPYRTEVPLCFNIAINGDISKGCSFVMHYLGNLALR